MKKLQILLKSEDKRELMETDLDVLLFEVILGAKYSELKTITSKPEQFLTSMLELQLKQFTISGFKEVQIGMKNFAKKVLVSYFILKDFKPQEKADLILKI